MFTGIFKIKRQVFIMFSHPIAFLVKLSRHFTILIYGLCQVSVHRKRVNPMEGVRDLDHIDVFTRTVIGSFISV